MTYDKIIKQFFNLNEKQKKVYCFLRTKRIEKNTMAQNYSCKYYSRTRILADYNPKIFGINNWIDSFMVAKHMQYFI